MLRESMCAHATFAHTKKLKTTVSLGSTRTSTDDSPCPRPHELSCMIFEGGIGGGQASWAAPWKHVDHRVVASTAVPCIRAHRYMVTTAVKNLTSPWTLR